MGAGVRAVCAAAPSARRPASRPADRCRLSRVSVCTHTRALKPASTRCSRVPAARPRVGARPSLPCAATGHLSRLGCFSLVRSVGPRAISPRTTSAGVLRGLWAPAGTFAHLASGFRGPLPAGGHTCCSCCCASAPRRPSFIHSLPLSPPLCQPAVSPPSGVYLFSRSLTYAPQCALKPGTLGET